MFTKYRKLGNETKFTMAKPLSVNFLKTTRNHEPSFAPDSRIVISLQGAIIPLSVLGARVLQEKIGKFCSVSCRYQIQML